MKIKYYKNVLIVQKSLIFGLMPAYNIYKTISFDMVIIKDIHILIKSQRSFAPKKFTVLNYIERNRKNHFELNNIANNFKNQKREREREEVRKSANERERDR